MKFILLSDVHATNTTPVGRNDDIMLTFKKKFEYVCSYAKAHKAIILQAGDLVDTPRNWHVLNAILSTLWYKKVKMYTVYGQHDMYMRNKEVNTPTTMEVLRKSKWVRVLNKFPHTIQDNMYPMISINFYGCSYGEPIPKPVKKMDGFNVLVIHRNISQKELYPGHDYMSPQYFIRNNPDWNLVLVGDIHRSFYYSPSTGLLSDMFNTGPMLRLEANEYNFKHKPYFIVWDTNGGWEKEIIPHEPAEEVLSRKHIKKEGSTETLEQLAESIEDVGEQETINLEEEILILASKIERKRTKRMMRDVILGDGEEDE